MPKFGTHLLIAQEAYETPFSTGDVTSDAQAALALGAIGPDLTLFMFDPASKQPVVREAFDTALEVIDTVDDLQDQVEALTRQITEPRDDLANWLTGGFSKDMANLVNLSVTAVLSALKLGAAFGTSGLTMKSPLFDLLQGLTTDPATTLKHALDPRSLAQQWVIDPIDRHGFPLRYFGHPYTDDGHWKQAQPPGDYREWWWMDLLHYRRTGNFTTNLYRRAQAGSAVQREYARGYLTHFAGDVCGHPFINAIVGGPFRNHAYRHMVLESLADTWLWDRHLHQDLADAHLERYIALSDNALDEITALLSATMQETYRRPMVPDLLPGGYPTVDDLRNAHQVLSKYLEHTTSLGYTRPVPPEGDLDTVILEMFDLLERNVPTAPPGPSGKTGLEFLTAILGWAAKGMAWLIMIATAPAALLTRLFYKNTLAWMVYFVQQAVYYVISGLRTLLCLMGYGYASRDDFDNFGFLEAWVTAAPGSLDNYPRQSLYLSQRPPKFRPPFYWLFPPWMTIPIVGWTVPTELPATRVLPRTPRRITPAWMLDRTQQMDPGLRDALFGAANPDETRRLLDAQSQSAAFGNPIDFSRFLLHDLLEPGHTVPNLDLDGDRGYAYRTWEAWASSAPYVR